MGRAGLLKPQPANLASRTTPTMRNVPAFSGTIEAEVLIQRVFVALEKALHEGLVHDRHRRRGFVVGCA